MGLLSKLYGFKEVKVEVTGRRKGESYDIKVRTSGNPSEQLVQQARQNVIELLNKGYAGASQTYESKSRGQ